MLEAIRNKTATWVVRVLAFFLILSFAAWGIEDVFRTRVSEETVAHVGGVRITTAELRQEYRVQVNRLQTLLGTGTITDLAKAKELGVLDRTLDAIIEGRLYGLEAHSLGLTVGDAAVRQRILADENFHTAAGAFDRNLFVQGLRLQGHSEASFVASLRDDIKRRQLSSAVVAGGDAPKPLAEAIFRYRAERRVAQVVLVPRSATPPVAEPGEEAIVEFHRSRSAEFSAPEYRALSVLYLDPRDLAKEIKPSEEKIREEYDSQIAALSIPERRRLKQIVTADEAVAARAAAALAEGKDFASVAKEAADMGPDAIDLGLVSRDQLPPALGAAAFELAQGAVSKPVRSTLGWHIIKLDGIVPGSTPTLAELHDRLAADAALRQAVDSLVAVTNKLEDVLAGGAKLEDAARTLNVKTLKIDAMDARGRRPSGLPVDGVPRDAAFVETAFASEPGATSTLQETAGGGYFILRVDRIVAPAVRPLDQVRDQVVAAFKRDRQTTAAETIAKDIVDKVTAGIPLATASRAHRLSTKASKPVTRAPSDAEGSPPASLVAALFNVGRGKPAMAPYDDGFAVGVVSEIQEAQPDRDKELAATIERNLRTAIAGDLLSQFSAALRERYPVRVDRAAVDALF